MNYSNQNRIFRFINCILMVLLFISWSFFAAAQTPLTKIITDLDKEIKEKKDLIDELERQTQIYQDKVNKKRQEKISLDNELAILDNRIAQTKINIKTTNTKIEKVDLEIKGVELQIEAKGENIQEQKYKLAEFLRVIHYYDQKSYLEILLLNNSFSQFFNQIQYLENIEEKLKKILGQLQTDKKILEVQQSTLEDKKEKLVDLNRELEERNSELGEKVYTKELLLTETQASQTRFESLLWQARQEQIQISNEIATLEKKIREELAKSESLEGLSNDLAWPVVPTRGISAYFHDPDYPFKNIFEHPAIDIRAYQGTEVKAAATGYVARAKDAGFGYSYVMIIHSQGLSTVYGHLSRIDLLEETYVSKGQVIGLSGGLPGTRGAGRLTTGPHLHFEVRLNGIPVNPLDYLP